MTSEFTIPTTPTFDHFDRVCTCLGLLPDDVLEGISDPRADATFDASNADALAALLTGGQWTEPEVLGAVAQVYFGNVGRAVRAANARIKVYVESQGMEHLFQGSGAPGVPLSQGLAALPPTESKAMRTLPLDALLFDLGMRAMHAEWSD